MPKALSLAHNSLGILALVAIVSLSVVTTLSLSPVVLRDQAHVAGAAVSSPKILSNFIPLTLTDLNDPSQLYTSQLVQHTQSQYKYAATFMPHEKGIYTYKLISIKNENSAPISLKLSVVVPQEIGADLNISVNDVLTEYRVHATDRAGREVEFEVLAQSITELKVSYELVQSISFPFNISFALGY